MFRFLSMVLLASATGWMYKKCFVYEDEIINDNQIIPFCPLGNLTASCVDISDVKQDLAMLPPRVNSLCLGAAQGLELRPNAFEQFSILEQLHIRYCPRAIHSGAFAGLPNLRLISFDGLFFKKTACCRTSFSANAFGQLPSLSKLFFYYYNMSAISTDVFSGIKELQTLHFQSCGIEILDIACKTLELSQSLTSLYVGTDDTVVLRRQHCPRLEDASTAEHFKTLKRISFVFPGLKCLGKSVFKYFQNISLLNMPMNSVLKIQLLQSGVQKIQTLEAKLGQGGLGSVCDIVYNLSVESLKLENAFSLCDDIELKGCARLREILLVSSYLQNMLCFIRVVKNLQVLDLRFKFLPQLLHNLCDSPDILQLLQKFSLNHSLLSRITRRQFYCLQNLQTLDLAFNKISVIEDFAFAGFDKLQGFYMKDMGLLSDNQTFNGLRSLEYLILRGNKILSINFTAFEGLTNLKVLDLHGNLITRISAKHSIPYLGLESLESLDLKSNRITYVDDFAFKQLKSLKTLILDNNNISEIRRFTFFGLDGLESLMIEYNVVNHIEPFALSNLSALRKFSVGCLKNPSSMTAEVEINLGLWFGRIPINLTELIISSCSHPMSIVIGSESAPKPGLQLKIFGQRVSFRDCEKPFFLSVVGLKVLVKQLVCGSHFAGKYFKFLESFELSSQVMTTFDDLVDLNTLLHLRYLKLTCIDLFDQPHLGILLHNLTALQFFGLYRSRIPSISEDLTKDLKSLKYLYLSLYNDLNVIDNFAKPLLNLRYIIMINMMLFCNCDNAWFNEWSINNRQVQVLTWSYTRGHALACRDMNGIQDFAKYSVSSCSLHVGFILYISTSLGILLFMLVVLVHNLAGDYLLAFIYIAQGWMDKAIRGSAKRHYQYDVFVSYSGTDESWVVDELLPNLERRGPPFLQLCLHSRDFQLGVDITENITGSLYRSRHTLCLLSRQYLRSKWCSLEMKLATNYLIAEHRDILIVVFLEKISPKLLSAHHRLARFVKRKTYLDWPQDPQQQVAFWDRLWAKLAPKSF
ncbi:toll-like receptor 13 [Tachysurus fulvidraco]|uniref:toll-like receptor 13 n=1 Tax=Tachysurus fulvidraco TaxID=1234273 RepID=UPI001FEEFCD8|nr:toll-like receptor 13 [Tachysurus fulvidraco]